MKNVLMTLAVTAVCGVVGYVAGGFWANMTPIEANATDAAGVIESQSARLARLRLTGTVIGMPVGFITSMLIALRSFKGGWSDTSDVFE